MVIVDKHVAVYVYCTLSNLHRQRFALLLLNWCRYKQKQETVKFVEQKLIWCTDTHNELHNCLRVDTGTVNTSSVNVNVSTKPQLPLQANTVDYKGRVSLFKKFVVLGHRGTLLGLKPYFRRTRWRDSAIGRAIDTRDYLRYVACSSPGQAPWRRGRTKATYTYVLLSPSSITWYHSWWRSEAGKVTVGLATP